VPCLFLGYSLHQSAYLCYDLATKRMYVSRPVIFIEDWFPYTLESQIMSNASSWYHLGSSPASTSDHLPIPFQSLASSQSSLLSVSPSVSSSSVPSSSRPSTAPVQPASTARTHSVHTRSQNNIFKPKHSHLVTKHPLHPSLEPTCVTQALRLPEWRTAISFEFNALLQNGTWILVPPTPAPNLVGSKWIFCIKRRVDGTIDKYKARLVAKRYNQWPGVDYRDTFSPVLKLVTIRVVLTLAVTHKWPLYQLDVNNAFLHGLF
jgi:hypothetical protein